MIIISLSMQLFYFLRSLFLFDLLFAKTTSAALKMKLLIVMMNISLPSRPQRQLFWHQLTKYLFWHQLTAVIATAIIIIIITTIIILIIIIIIITTMLDHIVIISSRFCEAPASVAPYVWPDDITKWPICRFVFVQSNCIDATWLYHRNGHHYRDCHNLSIIPRL